MQMIPLQISDEALDSIRTEMLKSAQEAFQQTATQQSTKRFMSKKEACKYLDVSYRTLQKFISLGLKVVTVEGITKLDKKDLDSFMNEHKI